MTGRQAIFVSEVGTNHLYTALLQCFFRTVFIKSRQGRDVSNLAKRIDYGRSNLASRASNKDIGIIKINGLYQHRSTPTLLNYYERSL
jgi:hypothetical protein